MDYDWNQLMPKWGELAKRIKAVRGNLTPTQYSQLFSAERDMLLHLQTVNLDKAWETAVQIQNLLISFKDA